MVRRSLLSAAAALLSVATVAGAQVEITQTPAQAAPSIDLSSTANPTESFDLPEVDRRARTLMARPGMVGMAVAVIDDGKVVFAKGYGRTENRRGAAPVDGDTVFRWASVSKSVAAATALSVAEDGSIGLSSPVAAYAPDAVLPDTERPITLEHVLSHQVGITRNAFDGKIEEGRPASYVKTLFADAHVTCEPGECHNYQNVAYDLSRDVVETATGLPYKAVVAERIFEPLGLDTATATLEGLVTSENWARPHNRSGRPYGRVKPTYFRIPAAAGVNSSVTDLARWLVANMDSGMDALDAETRAEMQRPRTRTWRRNRLIKRKYPFMQNASYGLGWRLYDYEGGGRVVAHRGAVQGYRANVVFDPATGDGVALLWNSNSSRPNGLAYEIMDQSYGKPRRDWLGLNPAPAKKRLKTVRRVKAKPKPALTPEEEADRALMEDALAATGPFPDAKLSGSGD